MSSSAQTNGQPTETSAQAIDWSRTPLGRADTWPVSLRTAVGLCLDCPLPALLVWGPEWLLVYNEASRPLLEGHHPSAMGNPLPSAWPLGAHSLSSHVFQVLHSRQSVSTQGVFLGRRHDLSVTPVRDDNGVVSGVFVLLPESPRVPDPTSEAYRLLFENARDIVLFLRPPEGNITAANDAAVAAYGYSRAELLTMRIHELREPSTAALVPLQVRLADEHGIFFETIHRRRDGSTFPVEISSRGATVGGERLLLSIIRDISDRQNTEKELRASEERFRDLFENAEDAIYTADLEGRLTACNRRAEELFGYTREEILGRISSEAIPPEYHSRMEEALRRKLAGEPSTAYELEIIRNDGERVPVEVNSRLIFQDGKPVGVQGIARDLSQRKRAERELRQSEVRFRQLFEQSPLGILSFSPEGRVQQINRTCERMWGVTFDQMADYNVLHDQQVPEWGIALVVERAFAGAAVEVPPVQYTPPRGIHQGQRRWVRSFLYPVKDESGQVQEVVLIHEDITEARQASEALRESEERLRLALDAGTCGVWDWDILANRITWSERIFEFYGLKSGQFSGTLADFTARTYPEDVARVSEAIRRSLEDDEPYCLEFRIVRPSGEVRWTATTGRVIRDGSRKPIRMLGATIDVTERRAGEEALREADRRKDDFLAMLAHELRNPLGPIRNAAHALRLIGLSTPEVEQARDLIERQVAHMARLIDDLLDVSRISRGKILLRKQPIDLSALVQATVDDHRPLLEGFGLSVTIELETPLLAEGDPTRLAQVVGNLLHNAGKFTDSGGSVAVRLRANGNQAILTIRDSGMGMDREMLARLFEPFSQADRSLDRSRGGLGLGLALVKGLVELHGGTVRASSDGPGRGSEFSIQLPLIVEARAEMSRTGTALVGRSLHVLVIEDNRDAAESLRLLLRLSGHEVTLAYTGTAGLEAARRVRPDVVVCDIGLPGGLDGYAVARALRAERTTADVGLLALSGYGQEEDQRHAREAGFDRHLTKPVDPVVLAGAMEMLAPRR
jgi:PAS domain S-box-containing protein